MLIEVSIDGGLKIDAAFGAMPLPAPRRRATDLGSAGQRRQPVGRVKDDPGALHVLEPPPAVADDLRQMRAVFGGDDHKNTLDHAGRFARLGPSVNPMIAHVH